VSRDAPTHAFSFQSSAPRASTTDDDNGSHVSRLIRSARSGSGTA
jgi:hypothetical protein